MLRFASVQILSEEFIKLEEQRLLLEKQCREIKKTLEGLREELQQMVGIAESLNIPHVVTVGNFCISQTKKHRAVQAYEYDYVEFKIIEVNK